MWVDKLENGKFKFGERYKDFLTGKIKIASVTLDKNNAQTRKLAQKILSEKIDKALSSSYDTKIELTLKELVERYRNYQRGKIKQSTYRRNFHACNALLRILGEDTLVNKLNKLYVEDCFDTSGDSEGTLSDRLTRLKALIRWGYKSEFVNDISFLDRIKKYESIPAEKEEDKFLESDELKKLLDGMEIERWRMVTEYMALSGQRIGEVIDFR
jgi:integrase